MIPMKLQFVFVCYFHSHFNLTSSVEVNEMYDKFKEIDPKIAIFDQNISIIQLLRQNL